MNLLLRTGLLILQRIGNGLAYIGCRGADLASWAEKKRDGLN